MEELKKEGVRIVGELQKHEHGKFGWIMDPEGNKIELWEPVDAEFTTTCRKNHLSGFATFGRITPFIDVFTPAQNQLAKLYLSLPIN